MLLPPLLALEPSEEPLQFQTVSEAQAPPVPLVVKAVPPTMVMYGLSLGLGIAPA